MSHLPPVATSWRQALLSIRPAEGGTIKPHTCPAGIFADENYAEVPTFAVRALAEGRRAELTFGGGAGPAFVVTRADEAGMTAVGDAGAAEAPARPAPLPAATVATALSQAEHLRDLAADVLADAKGALDWAIGTLTEKHARVRAAAKELETLEAHVASLRRGAGQGEA